MKKKIITKDIISTVAKSLLISQKKINKKSKSKDISKWDSLGTLKIMFNLEKKFKINIGQKNLNKLNSIPSIEKLLNKKKIKKTFF